VARGRFRVGQVSFDMIGPAFLEGYPTFLSASAILKGELDGKKENLKDSTMNLLAASFPVVGFRQKTGEDFPRATIDCAA
jgi:hypothetical protein